MPSTEFARSKLAKASFNPFMPNASHECAMTNCLPCHSSLKFECIAKDKKEKHGFGGNCFENNSSSHFLTSSYSVLLAKFFAYGKSSNKITKILPELILIIQV